MGFLRQLFKKDKPEEEPNQPETAPEPAATPAPVIDDTIHFVDTPPPPIPAELEEQLDPVTAAAVEESDGETTVVSVAEVHRTPWIAQHPLTFGYASHVGRTRRRNEDSALALTSFTLGEDALLPFGLFVVADGMGGHSDGHQASQFAARFVAREAMNHLYSPFLQIEEGETAKPIQNVLSDAVQAANWRVHGVNPESGTTLTAVLVLGNRLYAAHVGDTRAYLFTDKDSPAELLTVDHSFVQRLQDTGQITAEEASVHPQRNILYRAIGQGEKLDVDTFSHTIPRPGWLLICSDGLWGVVKPEFVQAVTTSAVTPQQACDELVEAALQAGGPDNITVIIAYFDELSTQPNHDTLSIPGNQK